jgi:hypothetical protein
MNVKLFGYSISLNLIILIAILYLIMTVNAITCACNEGFKFGRRFKKKPLSGDVVARPPSISRRFGRRIRNRF